ncbi:MAG: hypothetical protein AAF518_06340 [Spirochaetota bacterium]
MDHKESLGKIVYSKNEKYLRGRRSLTPFEQHATKHPLGYSSLIAIFVIILVVVYFSSSLSEGGRWNTLVGFLAVLSLHFQIRLLRNIYFYLSQGFQYKTLVSTHLFENGIRRNYLLGMNAEIYEECYRASDIKQITFSENICLHLKSGKSIKLLTYLGEMESIIKKMEDASKILIVKKII